MYGTRTHTQHHPAGAEKAKHRLDCDLRELAEAMSKCHRTSLRQPEFDRKAVKAPCAFDTSGKGWFICRSIFTLLPSPTEDKQINR